jgi:hypothetical protein
LITFPAAAFTGSAFGLDAGFSLQLPILLVEVCETTHSAVWKEETGVSAMGGGGGDMTATLVDDGAGSVLGSQASGSMRSSMLELGCAVDDDDGLLYASLAKS